MQRLTVEKHGGILVKDLSGSCTSPCFGCENIGSCTSKKISPCAVYRALEKLKEYEDLEEQGKLLKLPCAAGDTVYWVGKDAKDPIVSMTVHTIGAVYLGEKGNGGFMIEIGCHSKYGQTHILGTDFNKFVFFSKETAEQALQNMKEMKG